MDILNNNLLFCCCEKIFFKQYFSLNVPNSRQTIWKRVLKSMFWKKGGLDKVKMEKVQWNSSLCPHRVVILAKFVRVDDWQPVAQTIGLTQDVVVLGDFSWWWKEIDRQIERGIYDHEHELFVMECKTLRRLWLVFRLTISSCSLGVSI